MPAAIEAAGHLDKTALPEGEGVCRVLESALRQRALPVESVNGDVPAGLMGMWDVGGTDGVVVALEGEDRSGDLGSILSEHQWQRAHIVTFAAQSLAIKTVSI